MKVYISGRITGLEFEKAEAYFASAESLLENIGMDPVNPLRNGLPTESSWRQHMVKDIELLMDCEAILMLGSWIHSKGARIEKAIAEEMGLMVLHEQHVCGNCMMTEDIKEAIKMATGICYDQFIIPGKKLEFYYLRMITANHYSTVYKMSSKEISTIIKRGDSTVRHSILGYENELKSNPKFRKLVEKINKYLIKNVSQ